MEEEVAGVLVRFNTGREALWSDLGDDGIDDDGGFGFVMWALAEGGVVGAVGEWGEEGLNNICEILLQ